MPYRIAKTFEIESGHQLSKHPEKCRFPHGHSRKVEVVLAADALDAHDMVCDFKAVKLLLADFLARWDHALAINTADPQFAYFQQTYGERVVAFRDTDPTSEVMAKAIFDELQRRLALPRDAGGYAIGAGVRVERVRVTETSSSWAEYSA
ncbi:6-pyruvoyl trahydropterin synthase family protein [Oleiharenicola sp. Vm1]|uniref:6-pyruvoyl trahydropterin synthase family protein n=1 Tax=Oleiharenicola sp. Vm1 TaxID=3398393 RepID=UPI0039F5D8D8